MILFDCRGEGASGFLLFRIDSWADLLKTCLALENTNEKSVAVLERERESSRLSIDSHSIGFEILGGGFKKNTFGSSKRVRAAFKRSERVISSRTQARLKDSLFVEAKSESRRSKVMQTFTVDMAWYKSQGMAVVKELKVPKHQR